MKVVLNDYPQWASMARDEVGRWLSVLSEEFDVELRELQYSFVSDDEIIEINRDYLVHDYATDIITFEYRDEHSVSGEVFISVDTVISNATSLGVAEVDELDRVLAHGFLHIVGFNDKTPEEVTDMRRAEDKCLLLRAKIMNNK